MITLDVLLIGTILGALAILSAAIVWLCHFVLRFHRLERHDKLEYEARCVLMEAILAALDGLSQLGANGPVGEARSRLKEYLVKQR